MCLHTAESLEWIVLLQSAPFLREAEGPVVLVPAGVIHQWMVLVDELVHGAQHGVPLATPVEKHREALVATRRCSHAVDARRHPPVRDKLHSMGTYVVILEANRDIHSILYYLLFWLHTKFIKYAINLDKHMPRFKENAQQETYNGKYSGRSKYI